MLGAPSAIPGPQTDWLVREEEIRACRGRYYLLGGVGYYWDLRWVVTTDLEGVGGRYEANDDLQQAGKVCTAVESKYPYFSRVQSTG